MRITAIVAMASAPYLHFPLSLHVGDIGLRMLCATGGGVDGVRRKNGSARVNSRMAETIILRLIAFGQTGNTTTIGDGAEAIFTASC
jgi:hypothetical protein